MLLRGTNTLAPRDAAAALQRGDLQLVDVRETAELAAVRVPGAMNIPLRTLPLRLGELNRGRPVAFLCRSGIRGAIAARAAAKAGLDAANVRGGVIAWSRAGLPLISGAEGRGA
jgi:rhodanese-related sulfurtransferase